MLLASLPTTIGLTPFAECEARFFDAQREPLPTYIATSCPLMPEQPWDVYSRLSYETQPVTKRRTIPYPVPEKNLPKKVLVTAKHFPRTANQAISPRIWRTVTPIKSYKGMIAVYGKRAWCKRVRQIQSSKARQRQVREDSMCWWVYQEEAARQHRKCEEEYRTRQEAEIRRAYELEQERRRQEEEARQQRLQQEREAQREQHRLAEEAGRRQKIRQERAVEEEKKQRKEHARQEREGGTTAATEEEHCPGSESGKPEGQFLTGEALEKWQLNIIEQAMEQSHQARELANRLDEALSGF